jgi:uncharacterized protein YutE (UPF0331/DUF86 family)
MSRQSERGLLEIVRNELVADGYEVIVEPNAKLLPQQLAGYQPAAIAIKNGKKILVELIASGESRESDRRITNFLKSNPDWGRKVFILSSSDSGGIKLQEDKKIVDEVFRAIELYKKSHEMPALLVAWACLEASARQLKPKDLRLAQTPGRVIEILAMDGTITPTEADTLRELKDLRNKYIHGDFSCEVEARKIHQLFSVLRRLHPTIKEV